MKASPKIQNWSPMLESAAMLPTQSLDPSDTGPKLSAEDGIASDLPPMVKETEGRLASHGNV